MKSIVIFGGAGFVGKHLIRRLTKNGHKIIVPYQRSVQEAKIRLLGVTGQVIPFRYSSFCLLYTSPSPRDAQLSRMPSSA